MYWEDKPYYSLNYYLKEKYGEKVFKIALDAGFTCPNRDGTLDHRGCIFCSEGGSGDFASSSKLSITEQIEEGKKQLQSKYKGHKFIAYFQAYTNTYGDVKDLRKIYTEAANHPDIVGISIATRPDCITEEIGLLLKDLKTKTDVWVELGLQTIHNDTANLIRRGYDLECFNKAVDLLDQYHIDTIIHLILGLPYETKEQLFQSVDYVCKLPISGIKLQLLHVLRNTDLEKMYLNNEFSCLNKDEYMDLIVECIERIPSHIVIHRLTGDAPWKLLIAPKWSTDKKNIFNQIHKKFKMKGTFQGINCEKG